jgi:hypothetical protein
MKHDVMLDRLSEIARTSAPVSLPPAEEDEMVRLALERAARDRGKGEEARARRAGRLMLAAAAVVLLAAGATAAWIHSGATGELTATVPSARPEPLHVELPTGDRLTATPGASFRIGSSSPRERSVAMEGGTMVFDVARLGNGQAFEVETPHVEVRVLGTVFSVTAADDETIVRVFEGAVMVRDGDDRRIVRASQRLSSADGEVAPLDDASPLATFAWRAAAARASAPRATAANDSTDTGGDSALAEPTPPVPVPVTPPRITAPQEARVIDPAGARAMITEGRARRALSVARDHDGGEWRHVEADALRALRRFAEAANAYDRAASQLDGARVRQAGYLAASLRLLELDDPEGALASLDRAHADAPGSPFEERAIVLRVRALRRADRTDEARLGAQRYVESYPEGGMADYMRALIDAEEAGSSAEALDDLE